MKHNSTHAEINPPVVKTDSLVYKVDIVVPSNEIAIGDTFTADIVTTPVSPVNLPRIYLGPIDAFRTPTGGLQPLVLPKGQVPAGYHLDDLELVMERGIGKYEVTARTAGTKTITGVVCVKNSSGETYTWHPFITKYTVK